MLKNGIPSLIRQDEEIAAYFLTVAPFAF